MAGAMACTTVQVHLSRRCNLACAHCYTASGPREREELDPDRLIRFLGEAAAQGYRTVSFSGGEPFLYPQFVTVLEAARDLGLRRLAITNGTVMQPGRAGVLHLLDLVAVSVDGPPDVHNALRRSPTAFARMEQGLERVRASGIPFGLSHTVTRESLPHLPWMVDYAIAQGAQLVQLHPLGLVGAASGGGLTGLDGEMLARTHLTALALRAEYGARIAIHADLFNRTILAERPDLVIPSVPERGGAEDRAGDRAEDRTAPAPLADIINPLILMSNGDVSPICHALRPTLRLGNIGDDALAAMSLRYQKGPLAELQNLCATLFAEVVAEADPWPWLNWYELLEQRGAVELAEAAAQIDATAQRSISASPALMAG